MPKRRYKPELEPSPPLRGVFTRSRSEIFLHRTRSGRARPDPNRRLSPAVPLPSPNLTSIKDLRLRRVFSIPERTDEIRSGDDRTIEMEEGGENERGDEFPKGSRPSDDDSMQCTPPEAVAALGFGTVTGGREIKDSKNHVEGGAKLDSKNPPKGRLGLAPCSRSKLVCNPSSFSYRRLLPFLTDLAKDEITPCESNPMKVERVVEEKLPLPCENLPPEPMVQLSSSEDPLNVQMCKTLDFVENSACEISALDPPTKLTAPLNLCDGQDCVPKPKSEVCTEGPIFDVEHLHRPYSPPVGEALSIEEMSGSMPTIVSLPKEAEMGHGTSVATLDIDKKPPISTSELGDIHSLETHASSPPKGILKRYTRGCKGICMCLDCVSFRIHADRAYEFSRKQMEEADETITGLLKELVNLRNLVEKSIVSIGGNGGFSVLQLNQEELIEGACRRASRAEEIANNRRRQMFNDLNVHCRIPGPRVTFAECIEEKDLSIT
ncbi:uncharacterized protein [Typha angustifolia]|uniref:uncharacterized protein n=1 Tax=Typha angustifolia TaxID=59011 RepID=UPI003C2FC514